MQDLPVDTIDVWVIRFDALSYEMTHQSALLDASEYKRAERFIQCSDRQRFMGYHHAMRLILANYLSIHPAAIQFAQGEKGKPFLALQNEATPLYFNLSHSHDCALCAVTRMGDVGIDIEYMRPDIDPLALVNRFFSSFEREAFARLPAHENINHAFFRAWTRKEAILKALGTGISQLEQYCVPVSEARLLTPMLVKDANGQPLEGYQLVDIALGDAENEKYVSSSAVMGSTPTIRLQDFLY